MTNRYLSTLLKSQDKRAARPDPAPAALARAVTTMRKEGTALGTRFGGKGDMPPFSTA